MKKKTIWISAAAAVVVLGAAGISVAVADPFDGDDRLSGQTLEKASAAAIAEAGEGTVREASASDDLDHKYDVEVRLTDGTEVDVALDENFDVVYSDRDNRGNDRDDDSTDDSEANDAATETGTSTTGTQGSTDADDVPLTDAERTGAEQAALAEVGDGTVTDIDRSDDADHTFEVEVTFADGRDVDVELTTDFQVVRVDDDSQPATN
jgi:uncharacterized membrane protein YkoI